MQLRPYQQECLTRLYERYQAGVRRALVCLPTGAGKTVIFAAFPAFFRMKNQMLVLAHREELLDQACAKIKRANPDLRVAVEQGSRRADAACDVLVASVPTLGRKDSERLARIDPDRFLLIVVDEAHHAPAETYRRVFEHFRVFDPDTRRLVVGFTATPRRGDGAGLDAIFEEITFSRNLPEMIDAGHLAPLAGYRVETDVDISGVKTRLGDYVTAQLATAVNVSARNDLVVDVYRRTLESTPTLCFCVDVAHAHDLAAAFNAAGIAAAAVDGRMDRSERRRVLGEFSAGRLRVLCNCMVLTEGYDESSVAGIILARPTKSTLLYTQMIGRGTRLHPGKEKATVIDIVDVTRDNKLTTLPDLFGLSGQFDMEGHTTAEVRKAIEWTERNRPYVRVDLATSLSDLRYRCREINLLELQTPPAILHLTEFAWTGRGGGSYRLGLKHGREVLVAPNILGQFDVFLRRERDGAPEPLDRAPSLREALRAADDYVRVEQSDTVDLVLRARAWRNQPASLKQVNILKQKNINVPGEITKGQASHLIGMML